MRDTATTRRPAAVLAGLVLLASAALAASPWADPAAPQAGPGAKGAVSPSSVGVDVRSTSQKAILARGKLKVRVTTGVEGRVRLRPKARPAGGGNAVRIGKARRVRFGRPGRKTVKLRLNTQGRAIVAACDPTSIVVQASLKATKRSAAASGDRGIATEPLSIDAPSCAAPGTSPGGGGGDGGDGGGTPNGNVIPPPTDYAGPPIPTPNADRCDFLDASVCLHPWPNDFFTVADPSTDSGRRINLNLLSMPANQPLGSPVPVKPIDPTEHNRNDGFSPGNLIVTRVPGLDNPQAFENTGAVPIDDPGAYDDPDQPVVVLNAETGERHPVWAEIDSNPKDRRPDPGDDAEARSLTTLIIRPLVNFEEGGRYVVALRDLKDENGDAIQPAEAFRVYRDNLITTQGPIEDRRDEMEALFEIVGQAGIQRSSLYLTWDFTVASERNLSERMLKIRDDAFSQLGDDDLGDTTIEGTAPPFTIDTVENLTPAQDDRMARRVVGTMTVPCYLTAGCGSVGATFNYGPDGLPAQAGTVDVQFTCVIPRAALDNPGAGAARPSLYGHGLLGSAGEVGGGNIKAMANEHNMIFCATDWYGFATQNIANILAILQDLSLFPLLVDGTQQGFLNFLLLGRLMVHPDGLISHPAFESGDGDPLIDTSKLFYDGNSQGGILGGGLAAVAPDFERAVLGVPGMNYSTLLRRSVDFEPYAEGQFVGTIEEAICDQAPTIPIPALATLVDTVLCSGGLLPDDTPLGLYDNYPRELERPLTLSLMQMLWDRGEANGYAHHMTSDPLADTPPHEVLLHAAYGDHQVANVTAEVEARTIGAGVYQPALDAGRHWEDDGSDPIFGIPSITSFPDPGSALVYWDGGPLAFPGGTETPPNENIPPRPPEFGADPHSYPRNDPKARAQKSIFLSIGGGLRNPCTEPNNGPPPPLPISFENGAATPCYANGYAGPP